MLLIIVLILQMFDTLHENCSLKLRQCTCHSDVFSTAAWRKSHIHHSMISYGNCLSLWSALHYLFLANGQTNSQYYNTMRGSINSSQALSSNVIQEYNLSTTMNVHLPFMEGEPSIYAQDFIMLCWWRRSTQVVTWLTALDQRQSGEVWNWISWVLHVSNYQWIVRTAPSKMLSVSYQASWWLDYRTVRWELHGIQETYGMQTSQATLLSKIATLLFPSNASKSSQFVIMYRQTTCIERGHLRGMQWHHMLCSNQKSFGSPKFNFGIYDKEFTYVGSLSRAPNFIFSFLDFITFYKTNFENLGESPPGSCPRARF